MNKRSLALILIIFLFASAVFIACAPVDPETSTTAAPETKLSTQSQATQIESIAGGASSTQSISMDSLPTEPVLSKTEPAKSEPVTTQATGTVSDVNLSDTKPSETKPVSTKPTETKPAVTIPASTSASQAATIKPTQISTVRPAQTPTTQPTQAPTVQPTQTSTTQAPATEAPKIYYMVRIRSAAQAYMPGIRISVYADETMQQLVGSAMTNSYGDAQLQMPYDEKYVLVLEAADIPKGFRCEPFYRFTGNGCMITLTSAPIPGQDVTQGNFRVGDVIYDFTVTDIDGVTHTLSQILQEKKMVIINFFFINCVPCRSEMPYLQAAYE